MQILLILSRWIHQLALGIWIGGLLVIGAIVAPIAFRHAGLDSTQAGNVVGNSFLRFNLVCYGAGALLLLSEVLEWALSRSETGRWRRLAGIRFLVSAALVGLTLYLGLVVAPQMFQDRAEGRKAAFDAAHDGYGTLANVQFWLAAGVALLTAMMHRSAAGSEISVEPETAARRVES